MALCYFRCLSCGFKHGLVQDFQRNIMFFFPLNLGTLSRYCVLEQGTLPSHASFHSCVNDYLARQRQCVPLWQCVRLVHSAEITAGLYALRGGKMAHY